MPSKRTGPKQNPKPSKEVQAMLQAAKAKKDTYRTRGETKATSEIVRRATEEE